MTVSEVMPGLYVGDAQSASDMLMQDELRPVLIINCSKDLPFQKTKSYAMCIRMPVNEPSKNDKVLGKDELHDFSLFSPLAVRMIRSAYGKMRGAILVYCESGQQQSCALIAAYFSTCYGLSTQHAIDLVKMRKEDAFYGDNKFISVL